MKALVILTRTGSHKKEIDGHFRIEKKIKNSMDKFNNKFGINEERIGEI